MKDINQPPGPLAPGDMLGFPRGAFPMLASKLLGFGVKVDPNPPDDTVLRL